jgi:hypothetical protein
MSLKVIRRHGLEDPDGLIDQLVNDPVERVRVQAWTTLGWNSDAHHGTPTGTIDLPTAWSPRRWFRQRAGTGRPLRASWTPIASTRVRPPQSAQAGGSTR